MYINGTRNDIQWRIYKHIYISFMKNIHPFWILVDEDEYKVTASYIDSVCTREAFCDLFSNVLSAGRSSFLLVSDERESTENDDLWHARYKQSRRRKWIRVPVIRHRTFKTARVSPRLRDPSSQTCICIDFYRTLYILFAACQKGSI